MSRLLKTRLQKLVDRTDDEYASTLLDFLASLTFPQRTRSVSRVHGASQQEAMANILQVDKEASMF